MKSTLKIIKNNMFTILVIIVFVIGMFALSYLKKIYWDDNDQAAYGDRTEGIENYVISDEDIKKIENRLAEDEDVISVEYDLEGKIINLMIKVEDKLSVKNAKLMGNDMLKILVDENILTESQLSFYAVQIYFIKDDASLDDFPIMGYKHYSSDEISWTKDREASTNEAE